MVLLKSHEATATFSSRQPSYSDNEKSPQIEIQGLDRNSGLASYFASLQARRADILTLRCSANKGTNALDIWIPTAAGLAHGVGDVIAEAWSFAAYVAV